MERKENTAGRKIRRLRKMRGMTHNALAKEAGIARDTLLKIENGIAKKPSRETLSRIAEVLEIAVDELI